MTPPSKNEEVDIVDESGNVIGVATREQMRQQNLLHRSVFIVVRNDSDEILVHKRADWKDIWPSFWDIAVGGVVATGEAWEIAAARELNEEIGITGELQYLGEEIYVDDNVAELARVYTTYSSGPFTLSDEEIVELQWVPMADLRDWAASADVCPDSLALVLPRLDAP